MATIVNMRLPTKKAKMDKMNNHLSVWNMFRVSQKHTKRPRMAPKLRWNNKLIGASETLAGVTPNFSACVKR